MPNVLELTCCQKFADIFYDISAAVISLVDVITDILITIEFWQHERYAFFYTSMAIYFLAQCSYSLFFTLAFADNLRNKYQIVTFLCVFPFAQFIPVFVWLHSFRTRFTDACIRKFNLKLDPFSSEKECPTDTDELQFWIEQKFLSHGGFMIEAIIEAFPQSS